MSPSKTSLACVHGWPPRRSERRDGRLAERVTRRATQNRRERARARGGEGGRGTPRMEQRTGSAKPLARVGGSAMVRSPRPNIRRLLTPGPAPCHGSRAAVKRTYATGANDGDARPLRGVMRIPCAPREDRRCNGIPRVATPSDRRPRELGAPETDATAPSYRNRGAKAAGGRLAADTPSPAS